MTLTFSVRAPNFDFQKSESIILSHNRLPHDIV